MSSATDPDEVATAARRRLEADADRRVDAVRAAAEAARAADDADAAARTANTAHAAAWAAAITAGWDEKELRQIGLRSPTPAPANTSGGRRRNRAAAPIDPAESAPEAQ